MKRSDGILKYTDITELKSVSIGRVKKVFTFVEQPIPRRQKKGIWLKNPRDTKPF